MRLDKLEEQQIVALVGEDALTLVEVVGELLVKIRDEVPLGLAISFEIDRMGDFKDDIKIRVGRQYQGEVEFILWWNDGKFELRPINIYNYPLGI